jgi:hypothetical protein
VLHDAPLNRSDEMKGLLLAAGLVLFAAPAFAQCPADERSESEWAALSEDQKATCIAGNPEILERMAPLVCAPTMSAGQCYSAIRDAIKYDMHVTEGARAEHAEAERKAALPHNDPGAVSLCAPPYSMGRDGCQLYRPLE